MITRSWTVLCLLLACAVVAAQPVSQTPDCLFVDSRTYTALSLFIYVPPDTASFTLGVFDQAEDVPVAQPSTFILRAPDGSEVARLEDAKSGEWSDYHVEVAGRRGVWLLAIRGPQAPPAEAGQSQQTVRNSFMVRTVGHVDLYLRPEPAPRRLPLSEPQFGGEAVHRMYIQVPDVDRLRIEFLRSRGDADTLVELTAPQGFQGVQDWGGLERGRPEHLQAEGANLEGLWELTVREVKGFYRLGVEQRLRVLFTPNPVMPMPQRLQVDTFVAEDETLVPARLTLRAPEVARERHVLFTNASGRGSIFLIPGVEYHVTSSRGFEYEAGEALVDADTGDFSVPVTRLLNRRPGWYCGDSHTHTVYSDGNDTPVQMNTAARADGLDWVALTDHGAGADVPHVLKAHEEAAHLSEPGRFVMVPGEEYTLRPYHANVLGGILPEPSDTPLQAAVDATLALDTDERPMTFMLNHPHWRGTPQAPGLARELERLPMIELWNAGPEPQSIHLWWELLNKGLGTIACTNTDTHNLESSPPGHRRTYIYLGDEPLTVENVIRGMREGRGFLSRAALLHFTVNGHMPGDTITAGELEVEVEVDSARPVARVEIIHNGEVVQSWDAEGEQTLTRTATLQGQPGWVLAMVMEEGSNVPLAMSNPVFLEE